MNKANNNTASPDHSREINQGRIADELDAAGDFMEAAYMAAASLSGPAETALQRLALAALEHIEKAQAALGFYQKREDLR